MKELTKKEELKYYGGDLVTAAMVTAASAAFNVVLDAGRYLGSALRRIFTNSTCDF